MISTLTNDRLWRNKGQERYVSIYTPPHQYSLIASVSTNHECGSSRTVPTTTTVVGQTIVLDQNDPDLHVEIQRIVINEWEGLLVSGYHFF